MANVVLSLASYADSKLFNNGVGLIKYGGITVAAGSCAECVLPHNAQAMSVHVELSGSEIPIASYTLAYVAETTLVSAKVLATLGTGLAFTPTAGFVRVGVVM
jgi:hypothetical protein